MVKAIQSSLSPKNCRVAVIGAGGRALAAHYPSLHELSGTTLVAVADLDENRAHTAAERFGIPGRYTNFEEMIDREKPDCVYAIMPPHHIYDVAASVIERGCHLFIEKPPGVTTEQVRQLDTLARKTGVLTGVTFQRRFSPVIRRGKTLCEQRGPVHTAHAVFYKNQVGAAPYYRGALDMLTCDGIHAVDTLRYLCGGEVESVASDSRRLDAEHWNIHVALVKFSSGATGILLVNFMAGQRSFTVEIHSPGISVFADPEEGGEVFAENRPEAIEQLDPFCLSKSQETHRAYGPYDTHRHFIDCIRRGTTPETHFGDAVKTMELVDAVYQGQI